MQAVPTVEEELDHCRLNILVSKKLLDRSDVIAAHKQVRGDGGAFWGKSVPAPVLSSPGCRLFSGVI